MKKLFCAGMALLIAGSSWAIENLRFSTGDSIYYVAPQDTGVFITFDFEHPGDTVIARTYFDLNRNMIIDQNERYGSNDSNVTKYVDGGENDYDSLVNGKWRSSTSSTDSSATNSELSRHLLNILFAPDSFYSAIREFTDQNGSKQVVLVAPLDLPQIIDTMLTGHVYSEKGALIETGFTVSGPGGTSLVTDGSYALGLCKDTTYNKYGGMLLFGPHDAFKHMYFPYDSSAYGDSMRNLVFVTNVTIQKTDNGRPVRKTLDLHYDLTPTVVNITMLDTISGDTVKDSWLSMEIDLIFDENYMAPLGSYKQFDSAFAAGVITRHLYMGKYHVGVRNGMHYDAIDTITVLAGDTVLNITLKIGSIPSAIFSEKSKPMAHDLGLSVAVRTEAGHGVCMDWTGTQVSWIEISSLAGGKVMTYRPASGLKNGRIIWDGTTMTGNRVAPGVYLVRFETGTREYIKKAMLIH